MQLLKPVLVFFTTFILNTQQINSQSFTTQQKGAGNQSIILIPGFASSGEVWNETVAEIEGDYTFHILTMAGFAGTKPDKQPSFEKWKQEIFQYITVNNIQKPIIIGHSMGGVMAMALAAEFPDLLSSIVVVDALPCLPALMNPQFQSNSDNDCSPMIQQITSMSDSSFAQMQKMNVVSMTSTQSKFNEIVNWSISTDRYTFAKIYCDFANTDLREKIKTIKVPSLILLENYFKNIEANIADQYKNLTSADMRYATKGLHFVMYDDKDWYIQQINNFLTQP